MGSAGVFPSSLGLICSLWGQGAQPSPAFSHGALCHPESPRSPLLCWDKGAALAPA